MSMQDSIADLFTHIRNGQAANKKKVTLSSSREKVAVVNVLKEEGYIENCRVIDDSKKPKLEITLKYYDGKPVISKINRVSSPGLRIYKTVNKLPKVLGGLGIAIVSTSKGIVSDSQARKIGCGGEVLCVVE